MYLILSLTSFPNAPEARPNWSTFVTRTPIGHKKFSGAVYDVANCRFHRLGARRVPPKMAYSHLSLCLKPEAPCVWVGGMTFAPLPKARGSRCRFRCLPAALNKLDPTYFVNGYTPKVVGPRPSPFTIIWPSSPSPCMLTGLDTHTVGPKVGVGVPP
ncbi:hypothetical protein FA13DRAFT_1715373 [Coprinellus micaceus]|uniref:Uncharacterized protein n=1 Tax=Coprinellus micaceus TaxID=71717 RepID=A0A4Y7SNH8_COPMI|nr:hypothetical protein FA13DRAFT_1715373 [Coprinellus micaceus]